MRSTRSIILAVLLAVLLAGAVQADETTTHHLYLPRVYSLKRTTANLGRIHVTLEIVNSGCYQVLAIPEEFFGPFTGFACTSGGDIATGVVTVMGGYHYQVYAPVLPLCNHDSAVTGLWVPAGGDSFATMTCGFRKGQP